MKSYGYMVYEASIGLQTNPEDGSCYSQAYGYPIFNFGFSLARTGNFRFYDQTKFNDLYTIFGSFERTLLRRKWFSLGYLLDFGFTYNPGKYDPVPPSGLRLDHRWPHGRYGTHLRLRHRSREFQWRLREHRPPEDNVPPAWLGQRVIY